MFSYIEVLLGLLGLFVLVRFGHYLWLPIIIVLIIAVVSTLLSHWTGISDNYLGAGFTILVLGGIWLYRFLAGRAGRKIMESHAKEKE